MTRISRVIAALAFFSACSAVATAAEEVVFLKNGSVYEGRIKAMTAEFLDLETDGGLLRIPAMDLDNAKAPNGMVHFDRIPILKIYQIKLDAKDESRAEKVLDKLNAGGNFEQLANSFSIDAATKDMGFIRVGETIPEIASEAFRLKIGDTSGLIRSNEGFHIIKVADIRYKDRDSGEYFDSKGDALPLEKITLRLYKTVNTGKPAEDAKAADKVYELLNSALKKYEIFTVVEEAAAAPDMNKLQREETGALGFHLTTDVSIAGEYVRLSYRLGREYNYRFKSDSATFRGLDNAGANVEKIAADIYKQVPKTIDERKLSEKSDETGKVGFAPGAEKSVAPPAPPAGPSPVPPPPKNRPAPRPRPQPNPVTPK
jgi:hypothetical protein